MSELGIASRREADDWIARGWVRVDGRVVAELGSRVLPGQHITIDARARNAQARLVTVLLNKPVGYVSGQAEDGYQPARVLVTPDRQWRDGQLGDPLPAAAPEESRPGGPARHRFGRPARAHAGRPRRAPAGRRRQRVEKEYLVRVATRSGAPLPPADLARLCHGLELDGEALLPARVEWVNDDQLRFVLREGKKRQIRRMCDAVGLQVLGLKRVRIGAVALGALPPGSGATCASTSASSTRRRRPSAG
jgi:23S rRNA pseudouridine2604 synthase